MLSPCSARCACSPLPVPQGLDLVRLFYNLLPQRHNW